MWVCVNVAENYRASFCYNGLKSLGVQPFASLINVLTCQSSSNSLSFRQQAPKRMYWIKKTLLQGWYQIGCRFNPAKTWSWNIVQYCAISECGIPLMNINVIIMKVGIVLQRCEKCWNVAQTLGSETVKRRKFIVNVTEPILSGAIIHWEHTRSWWGAGIKDIFGYELEMVGDGWSS